MARRAEHSPLPTIIDFKAQMARADYRQVTGRWIAIIAITPPPQQSGNATFAYDPRDQAIPGP